MFRKMRRFKQALPEAECAALLTSVPDGVLAVNGEDGYPYAVPVNHVYEDGHIYFHCALEGHKADAIRGSEKVSFCVVSRREVLPEERTTAYESVIAFGRAAFIAEEGLQRHVCDLIAHKFCPNNLDACYEETEETIAAGRLGIVDITIDHVTGKCGRKVMEARRREGTWQEAET